MSRMPCQQTLELTRGAFDEGAAGGYELRRVYRYFDGLEHIIAFYARPSALDCEEREILYPFSEPITDSHAATLAFCAGLRFAGNMRIEGAESPFAESKAAG